MPASKFAPALLYIAIFAGIPLAIIVALYLLPVLNTVDPTAIVILIIFTIILVSVWLFVPQERPVLRRTRTAKEKKATVKRAVPESIETLEGLAGKEEKRKARSRRALFTESEKREPFVEAVERSTRHPAAQPQVRRKAQSKARKKTKKKR